MYGSTRLGALVALALLGLGAGPGSGAPALHRALREAIEERFTLELPGLAVSIAPLVGDPDGSYRLTVETALAETRRIRVAPGSPPVARCEDLPADQAGLVEGSFRVRSGSDGDRLVCYLSLTLKRDGSRPWVFLEEVPLDRDASQAALDLGRLLRRHGMPLGVALVALSAVLATLGLASGRAVALHPTMVEAARVLDRVGRAMWWYRVAPGYKPDLAAIREEIGGLCQELVARPEHQVRVEGLGFKDEERRAVLYLDNRIAHLATEVAEIAGQMGETLRPSSGSPELARQQLDGIRRRLAEVRDSLERRKATLGTLMA